MTPEQVQQAIRWLDNIDESDPEAAHTEADSVLLRYIDADLAAAYRRVGERCEWWVTA